MATCERCGRVVEDGSTDFGGFILKPTCEGIEVRVKRDQGSGYRQVCYVSADELRHFLARAYGDPVPS
jgi:hypothetical protein